MCALYARFLLKYTNMHAQIVLLSRGLEGTLMHSGHVINTKWL